MNAALASHSPGLLSAIAYKAGAAEPIDSWGGQNPAIWSTYFCLFRAFAWMRENMIKFVHLMQKYDHIFKAQVYCIFHLQTQE